VLPAAEQRTLHVVTARGADHVPAVRATLAALVSVVRVLSPLSAPPSRARTP
jgi:hypothetical protein